MGSWFSSCRGKLNIEYSCQQALNKTDDLFDLIRGKLETENKVISQLKTSIEKTAHTNLPSTQKRIALKVLVRKKKLSEQRVIQLEGTLNNIMTIQSQLHNCLLAYESATILTDVSKDLASINQKINPEKMLSSIDANADVIAELSVKMEEIQDVLSTPHVAIDMDELEDELNALLEEDAQPETKQEEIEEDRIISKSGHSHPTVKVRKQAALEAS